MNASSFSKGFVVFGLLALASAGASANDLALTSDSSKRGGTTHSIDFFSSGNAAGLEVRLDVAGGDGVSVDVTKCASALPKSHVGSCVFNGKEVVILVYSMQNAALPEGIIDLGSVSVSGGPAKRAGLSVSKFIAANLDGPVETRVVGGSDDDLVK